MANLPPFDPGPIVGIRIYAKDVVVVRQGRLHPGNHGTAPKRGAITMLSKKSRQRLAFVANNTSVTFRTMVTLTYPREYPTDGKTIKKHLNAFLVWARRRFAKPSYLWFLEFQKRGAPHVHILLDYPLPQAEAGRRLLFGEVSAQWYKVVGSGDKRHLLAGTRCERIRKPDGAARYCLKYAYKTEQKCVPDGYRDIGRFWGCSRDVQPSVPRVIPIDEGTVRAVLADWDYCPDEDTLVYQTLFGCADRFRSYSGIRVWADLTKTSIDGMLVHSTSGHNEMAHNHKGAV